MVMRAICGQSQCTLFGQARSSWARPSLAEDIGNCLECERQSTAAESIGSPATRLSGSRIEGLKPYYLAAPTSMVGPLSSGELGVVSGLVSDLVSAVKVWCRVRPLSRSRIWVLAAPTCNKEERRLGT